MECFSVPLTVTMMVFLILTAPTHGVADGGTTSATNLTSLESIETQMIPRVSIGITGKVSFTQ